MVGAGHVPAEETELPPCHVASAEPRRTDSYLESQKNNSGQKMSFFEKFNTWAYMAVFYNERIFFLPEVPTIHESGESVRLCPPA